VRDVSATACAGPIRRHPVVIDGHVYFTSFMDAHDRLLPKAMRLDLRNAGEGMPVDAD